MMDEELGINRRPTSRFGQAPFSSLSEQEDIPLEEEKKYEKSKGKNSDSYDSECWWFTEEEIP
jgi:hypothetical protein